MKIKRITTYEILDSRGNPTVKVKLQTSNNLIASASVPSGASTGIHEALELRDEDPKRFLGKGVKKALQNINDTIAPNIINKDWSSQAELDQAMLSLDGTKNKSKLGANAILGVSLAAARAFAYESNLELWSFLNQTLDLNITPSLPTPTCNVINGGAHADWVLDFQEFMIVPNGLKTFSEKIRAASEIYSYLRKNLKKHKHIVSVGDEGGFAPKLKKNEDALKFLMESIEEAGYKPKEEISLAMDTAVSELYNTKKHLYELRVDKKNLTSDELIDYYQRLIKKYPIILIEDGMAEDDLAGWQKLKATLGDQINLMGDDFTVTNKERLKWAIENNTLNSILIKLNQIGTVTETLETIRLAYQNNVKASISHRSGETCDNFIADLAFGVASTWIKSGSLSRSERLSKYNRLIEIEQDSI